MPGDQRTLSDVAKDDILAVLAAQRAIARVRPSYEPGIGPAARYRKLAVSGVEG